MDWKEKLERYDNLVAKCSEFDRKGKNMPYTSANGYMFSLLNKDGELGIRFAKDVQEKYLSEWNSTYFKSHGATMKGYVLIPEKLFNDMDVLANYLNESYNYVLSLDPK